MNCLVRLGLTLKQIQLPIAFLKVDVKCSVSERDWSRLIPRYLYDFVFESELRPYPISVVLFVDQSAQLMRLHKLTKLSNESSSPCSTFHAHKVENRQLFSTSSATILLFFFILTNQRRGFSFYCL